MAKKRKGHEMAIYYGTAGSTASTHIDAKVVDIDPGGADFEFVDMPDRGDGSWLPQQDERPVKQNIAPTFSMIYHDGDSNMTALLAAANFSPPVGKAFKIVRIIGGSVAVDGDFYIKYASAGAIADGQTVEFELHPTSDYGRGFTTA